MDEKIDVGDMLCESYDQLTAQKARVDELIRRAHAITSDSPTTSELAQLSELIRAWVDSLRIAIDALDAIYPDQVLKEYRRSLN